MFDSSYTGQAKVIHAADLHLDSPFKGLERYEGAPVEEITEATRGAFTNLVDHAVDDDVDLVLLAGDVYDGDWPDYNTGLFFAGQLKRLQDANVQVVIVNGNHDAVSVITKTLRLPANTKVLSHARPESVRFDDLGIAVTGQSFATRDVTEDLSAAFPAPEQGYVNFALLHTSADGRPGHAPYAPCNPVELALRGFDYYALGHVHTREILSESPWIAFSGSLQGRHARETGAKGFYVVEVSDNRIVRVAPVDCDVVRWERIDVDASELASLDEVLAAFAEDAARIVDSAAGRLVACRVVIAGSSPAHAVLARDHDALRAELCGVAIEVAGSRLWLEKVKVETSAPARVTSLVGRDDSASDLLRLIRDTTNADGTGALTEALGPLRKKLPAELRTSEDGVAIGSPEHVALVLSAIESRLAVGLSQQETAE
jgi:DNA repair exonuclease SbcCD nuclease subunit